MIITDHATAIGSTTSASNETVLIFAMITAGSATCNTYLSAHAVTTTGIGRIVLTSHPSRKALITRASTRRNLLAKTLHGHDDGNEEYNSAHNVNECDSS
jgi:hypothetical protein